MFKRIEAAGADFAFTFDGREVRARDGDSIATALLAAGEQVTRTTPVGQTPRGPFCMMGACFDCLAEVDGVGGVQTCLVPAQPGMVVNRQIGVRDLDEDAA
jgi:predicted molibdopterin-dependent oxidoreductase YjgC